MPRNKNIKRVAKTVISQIKNGERPNVTKAMLEVGYSRTTAEKKQKDITSHKEYKEEMFDFEKELDILLKDAVEGLKRTKNKANYRDFNSAIDTIHKNKRLIQGKTTENHGISSILDDLEK